MDVQLALVEHMEMEQQQEELRQHHVPLALREVIVKVEHIKHHVEVEHTQAQDPQNVVHANQEHIQVMEHQDVVHVEEEHMLLDLEIQDVILVQEDINQHIAQDVQI